MIVKHTAYPLYISKFGTSIFGSSLPNWVNISYLASSFLCKFVAVSGLKSWRIGVYVGAVFASGGGG